MSCHFVENLLAQSVSFCPYEFPIVIPWNDNSLNLAVVVVVVAVVVVVVVVVVTLTTISSCGSMSLRSANVAVS